MKLAYAIERYVARRRLDGVRFRSGEGVLANLLRKTGDCSLHRVTGLQVASLKDFRHTFAVHCLNRWLKEGKDLRHMLPALAAYMGHVKWNWTEQYLSSTPERFWKQLSHLGLARSH
jgi:integrase